VKRINGRRWKVLAVTPAGSSPPSPSDSRDHCVGSSHDSPYGQPVRRPSGYPHELYKQYEAAHPGVTINESIQSYADHHTQLAQHIATGAGAADVEAIEVGFIPIYTAQSQNFVDLRQYGASD
jgi:hypothetical protein